MKVNKIEQFLNGVALYIEGVDEPLNVYCHEDENGDIDGFNINNETLIHINESNEKNLKKLNKALENYIDIEKYNENIKKLDNIEKSFKVYLDDSDIRFGILCISKLISILQSRVKFKYADKCLDIKENLYKLMEEHE